MILPTGLNNGTAASSDADLTAADIADAVWDENRPDHTIANSTGADLQTAKIAALNAMALSA